MLEKKPNRDNRYIERKKSEGYVRLCMWVKKLMVNKIKEFVNTSNKNICQCYSEYLHGNAIRTCKCNCHKSVTLPD